MRFKRYRPEEVLAEEYGFTKYDGLLPNGMTKTREFFKSNMNCNVWKDLNKMKIIIVNVNEETWMHH